MPAVPAATSDPAEATATVRAAGKTIAEVAKLLRKSDPAQPTPYRLLRAGSWVAVNQPPPVEGGKTRLPAPSADFRKKLAAALESQRWMDLLNLAEDAAATSLFWFDLHRLVAVAMDNLGALFLGAREAVGREVVAFVERLPGVTGLVFADGTPFADAATKAWLEAEQQKLRGAGGGGAATRPAAIDDEDAEVKKRFDEARAMVGSGKVAEGLELAHQLANRGADERARFLARLEVGRLAIVGARPVVARATFEALNREVDARGLEAWEPKIAAAVSAGLLTALKAKAPDATDGERAARERLARVQPGAKELDS
jgi:type VI secretion system protein VasJ